MDKAVFREKPRRKQNVLYKEENMKHIGFIVNGFPKAVIFKLIEELHRIAEERVEEAIQEPLTEEHYEVVGMKRLVEEYRPSVEFLLRIVPVEDEDPVGLVTRHLVAFKDFLGKVSWHVA